MNKVNCTKCEGTGKLPYYLHIANGDCFRCNGLGYQMLTDKQLKVQQEEVERMERESRRCFELEEQLRLEEQRKREFAEERKQQNLEKFKNKLSYVGEVGAEIKLSANLKFRKEMKYDNYLYVLEDENKNNYSFFSKQIHFVIGQYEIAATIKEHKEVNGYKQTVLKDVTLLNEIDFSELTDEEIDQLPI